jgi:hypothetical protein
MLQYVSLETACGNVSFPRSRGKAGMGGSQHKPAQLHQQMLRVEAQMVFHEAGDKEVAVVITRLNT